MEYRKNVKKINVLIAPLDWGMGHATRCIPIINQLLINGCRVWLAGEGDTLLLLQKEFPALPSVLLDGYNVSYHKTKSNFSLKILRQLPRIIRVVYNENKWLQKFIDEESIDLVISDNRFGLFSTKAHTVFISHQMNIKTGLNFWVDRIATAFNKWFIKKFDVCWIPDFDGHDSLAGELSHLGKMPDNARYIGILSRFERQTTPKSSYKLVIVLSGPEPARSSFETKLLNELKNFKETTLLVRGTTKAAALEPPNIKIVDLMTASELNDVLTAAEFIICRSGYTSLMDLTVLQKKAILVPTPGQPEQEYLAQRLYNNKMFYCISESNFQLERTLKEAAAFPYYFNQKSPDLYKKFVTDLIKSLQSKMS